MTLYRITDWNKHYENNRTRAMDEMRWVPIPNKHDGDGYTEMVSGRDGAAILGGWLAVVQVASKCQPRGTLLRENGQPHDPRSLSRLTRLPESIFVKVLERASSTAVGWMEVVENTDDAGGRQVNVTRASGGCVSSTMEWNGMEGNGIEAPPYPPTGGSAAAALKSLGVAKAGDYQAIPGLTALGVYRLWLTCSGAKKSKQGMLVSKLEAREWTGLREPVPPEELSRLCREGYIASVNGLPVNGNVTQNSTGLYLDKQPIPAAQLTSDRIEVRT